MISGKKHQQEDALGTLITEAFVGACHKFLQKLCLEK
jgi:hypothetical protein